MKKRISFFVLLFIILLAALLRGEETISHNYLFLLDQGRDMMAVKSIVYDRHLTLIGPYTSLGGVFQGPLWYYLLAVPTILTNGDPWGGVLLMFFLSMLSIICVYFFMNKFFGRKEALVTTFLFTISPETIASATYTWNPHPMWLLVILFIFFFYQVILNNKKAHLFLWPTISLMFHFETAMGVFILITSLVYFIFLEKKQLKTKYAFYGICIAFIFFLPQFIFDLRHNFLMTKSVLKVFQGNDQGLFANGEKKGLTYVKLIQDHISTLYINFKFSFLFTDYLPFLPQTMIIFLSFMTILGRKLFNLTKKEESFAKFLFLFVILFFLITSFYPFQLRPWFLTGFQAFYLFLSGLYISKLWKIIPGKIIIVILFLTMTFYSAKKAYLSYLHPDYGGIAKVKGKIDAIDYIYKDARDKQFGLLIFAPPVYTFNYDYLIWWYGKRKYGFEPNREKKGIFYLLIEPDSAKPWSYNGWLETIIKVGRVIYTKELPSGLIVQKRIV